MIRDVRIAFLEAMFTLLQVLIAWKSCGSQKSVRTSGRQNKFRFHRQFFYRGHHEKHSCMSRTLHVIVVSVVSLKIDRRPRIGLNFCRHWVSHCRNANVITKESPFVAGCLSFRRTLFPQLAAFKSRLFRIWAIHEAVLHCCKRLFIRRPGWHSWIVQNAMQTKTSVVFTNGFYWENDKSRSDRIPGSNCCRCRLHENRVVCKNQFECQADETSFVFINGFLREYNERYSCMSRKLHCRKCRSLENRSASENWLEYDTGQDVRRNRGMIRYPKESESRFKSR